MNNSIRKLSIYQTGLLKHSKVTLLCQLCKKSSAKIPEPPPDGICCGSGCQNCCWLVYADELLAYYKIDAEEKAFDALKNVPDPMAREFLKMELKMKIQQRKKSLK